MNFLIPGAQVHPLVLLNFVGVFLYITSIYAN